MLFKKVKIVPIEEAHMLFRFSPKAFIGSPPQFRTRSSKITYESWQGQPVCCL